MSESLDKIIEEKFQFLSTPGLIRRIEEAPDFGYDDEEHELNRRLAIGGQAWRWASDGERVEVYRPEAES